MRKRINYLPKVLDNETFTQSAIKAKFHRDILTEVIQGYRRKDLYENNMHGHLAKELSFYAELWARSVHQLHLGFSSDFYTFLEQEATARTEDGRSAIAFSGEERNCKPIERAIRSVVREYVMAPLFEMLSMQELESGLNMHCLFLTGTDDSGNSTCQVSVCSHEERDRQGDFFSKPELAVDISSREAFEASIAKLKEEAQKRRAQELQAHLDSLPKL